MDVEGLIKELDRADDHYRSIAPKGPVTLNERAATALRELAAERDALRADNFRLRAYAAREQHHAENPEYPLSKAELRVALRDACLALHSIATGAALQEADHAG